MSIDKNHIIELVKQTQSGDQAAFAELYDEFAQRLYAFIRIKVVGTGEAEDILQEAFLKAWQGCRNLDLNNLNFSAWLYKITSNTINDYFRKKYRQPQTTALEEAAELAGEDNVTNDASSGFSKQVIAKTLDRLPAHYKEVIELRYIQEFSVKEAAEIMKKNSVTVRVWQHRAIKELEKLFKEYGQTPEEIL